MTAATQKRKAWSVVIASTFAFTICFMVWMMFAVIGIPIKSSTMDGLDSLLSMVQMPKGIPVATVAIDGSDNAGILAAQMLSLKYDYLQPMLAEFKAAMAKAVESKNQKIKEEAKNI